jgi:hypothetical protein
MSDRKRWYAPRVSPAISMAAGRYGFESLPASLADMRCSCTAAWWSPRSVAISPKYVYSADVLGASSSAALQDDAFQEANAVGNGTVARP